MEKDFSNIDDIVISFLNGNLTGNEIATLKNWLNKDATHKDHFRQLYQLWAASELMDKNEDSVEKALARVKAGFNNTKENPATKNKTYRRITIEVAKWAAVIIVSLFSGAFFYSGIGKGPSASADSNIYNQLTVPLGSKSKLRLPDGTEVTLNAGSSLTYNMDYGKNTREINFSGEAYFKVAKQKDKPFIVHTSNANIKALGTEFNVKAYPNEKIIETILVEGSVEVNKIVTGKDDVNKDIYGPIILKPGQKLQIFKNDEIITSEISSNQNRNLNADSNLKNKPDLKELIVQTSDVKVETSWKDKRWIIRGIDLEELSVLFSRRFNVVIKLKDKDLKKFIFSGLIENETIGEVMNIMKYTVPISYTINKGEVTWAINHEREKYYKEAY